MNWISGWHPISYSMVQRSDLGVWRLNRKSAVEQPAEDCPICSHLIGRGDSYPLPKPETSITLPLSLFSHTGEHHHGEI
jgi:hypothetical protein